MEKRDKRLSELGKRMGSSDPSVIIEAIETLRNETPFDGALAIIAGTFENTTSQLVRTKITEFMNDMKELSLRSELVGEIRKDYSQATIAMLVSSCWQSGIDYSAYADDFAFVFNSGDYSTAVECYTVISEFASVLGNAEKTRLISILSGEAGYNNPDKKALMLDLIRVLS